MDQENGVSHEREQIETALIDTVRGLSPEAFNAPEKKAHILDAITNGFDLIASDVGRSAQESGKPVREVALTAVWSISDFARTSLIYPLPGQAFEYEEGQVPLEVAVADEVDWWEILSEQQKRALSEVVGLDLTVDPPDRPAIIQEGEPHTYEDGTSVLPLFIRARNGFIGLSAIPNTNT